MLLRGDQTPSFSRVFFEISKIINFKEFNLRKAKSNEFNPKNLINLSKGIGKFKIDTFENYTFYKPYIDDLKKIFIK